MDCYQFCYYDKESLQIRHLNFYTNFSHISRPTVGSHTEKFMLFKLSLKYQLTLLKTLCMHACSVVSGSAIQCAVASQTPLFVEFSRQRYWSEFPFPPTRVLPDQGSNPCLLYWQTFRRVKI